MTKTFKATIIQKQYYNVEVEAESWDHAKEKLFEIEVGNKKPDDYDFDFYDLQEITK